MGEKEKQQLADDEIIWLRDKRKKELICEQRRGKIIDALLIWGSIGLATVLATGFTGVAQIVFNHLTSRT